MATLQELVAEPKYRSLRDVSNWQVIANDLNAPEVTSGPNPVTEAPLVFGGTYTLNDINATITDAEVVALARDEVKVNGLADSIGTPEAIAAAAAITRYMTAHENYDASVWAVARAALAAKDVAIIQTLVGLVVGAGLLSQASADAMTAAMLIPDPEWSDTVWEFGPSIAEQNELGTVTGGDVFQAARG